MSPVFAIRIQRDRRRALTGAQMALRDRIRPRFRRLADMDWHQNPGIFLCLASLNNRFYDAGGALKH